MLKTYPGCCDWGATRFEVEIDLTPSSLNCSIRRRTRFRPPIVRPEAFRLLCGEEELTRYEFITRKNHHCCCRHCGVHAFGIGNETPRGRIYGVNLAYLDDATEEELSRVPITCADGGNDRCQHPPAFFAHL